MRFLVLVVVLIAPLSAAAQTASQHACVAAIPATDFHRVGVFVDANADDAGGRVVLSSADLFAQAVVERIRSDLGAREGELPAADSVVHWRHVWSRVTVNARKDGTFSWFIPAPDQPADTVPTAGVRLLGRTLEKLRASGERILWPEETKADSIQFNIRLSRPSVAKNGKVKPVIARRAIAAFTINVPWEKPVELDRHPRIQYPERTRLGSVVGNVRMSFVIQADGKIQPGSISEVLPKELPGPGETLTHYRAFVRAVGIALPSARFSPAIIGGCAVDQKVIQEFQFKLDGPGYLPVPSR